MDAQALGRYLRESRETKEITLEEAEQVLKNSTAHPRIIRVGSVHVYRLDECTNTGFRPQLRALLGLDDDRVVSYYESALEEATNPRRKRSTRAPKEGSQAPKVPKAPRKITDTNPLRCLPFRPC